MEAKVPTDHKSHKTALCLIICSFPPKIVLVSMKKVCGNFTGEKEEERSGEKLHGRKQNPQT